MSEPHCEHCPLNPDAVCLSRTVSPRVCDLARIDREKLARDPKHVPRTLDQIRTRAESGTAVARSTVERPLPSLAAMAVNFARAQARHTLHGRPKASEEVAAARLATCRECPGGFFRESDQRCSHPKCGCRMRAKVTYADSECPIGEWGPVNASDP